MGLPPEHRCAVKIISWERKDSCINIVMGHVNRQPAHITNVVARTIGSNLEKEAALRGERTPSSMPGDKLKADVSPHWPPCGTPASTM